MVVGVLIIVEKDMFERSAVIDISPLPRRELLLIVFIEIGSNVSETELNFMN